MTDQVSFLAIFTIASAFLLLMFFLSRLNKKLVRSECDKMLNDLSEVQHAAGDCIIDASHAMSDAYLFDDFWSPSCPNRNFRRQDDCIHFFINLGNPRAGYERAGCAIIQFSEIADLDGYLFHRTNTFTNHVTPKNLPSEQYRKNCWIGRVGNKMTALVLDRLAEQDCSEIKLKEISLRNNQVCIRTGCIKTMSELQTFYNFTCHFVEMMQDQTSIGKFKN